MKKRMAEYEGNYRIKHSPKRRMAPHNEETWRKLEKELFRHGQASFDRLSALCKDHQHGTKSARHPYQFITYCIRNEWLQRVK